MPRRPPVRPSTDRLREALFNVLRDDVGGRAVIDCCCGTGALGLEALSRGAAHVAFVDIAPACLHTVRANLRRCDAAPETWSLHRADASRWLARHLATAGDAPLVLADAPYGGPVPQEIVAAVAAAASPPHLLVLEHPADATPPEPPGPAWRSATRRHGGVAFTIYRPQGPTTAEAIDG